MFKLSYDELNMMSSGGSGGSGIGDRGEGELKDQQRLINKFSGKPEQEIFEVC